MRISRSIAFPLIGLIVLISLVSAGVNWLQTLRTEQAGLLSNSEQRVRHMAGVVESMIRADAPRLGALARALSAHSGLSAALALPDADERVRALATVMDRMFKTSAVDVLQVSDRGERVLYRAHEPGLRGDVPDIWGVTEALGGDHMVVTSKGPAGLALRAISPIDAGAGVAGTVMVGSVFDDRFARRLANQTGTEIYFATQDGIWAASKRKSLQPERMRTSLAASLQQKAAVFVDDPEARKARLFLPLQIIDEAFILVVELDTAAAHAQIASELRNQLLSALAILLVSIMLGGLLTWRIIRPLASLKHHALSIANRFSQAGSIAAGGNEIDSLARAFAAATTVLEKTTRQANESERAVRAMVDSLPLMIAVLDSDLRFEYANRPYEEWVGAAPGTLTGRVVGEILGAAFFAIARPRYLRALAGEAGSAERAKTMADGSVRHVLGHHVPRFGSDGGVDGIYVVLIDITDRKASEAALVESEAKASRLALVASRTSNSVMITDAQGRVEWVNEGFTRLTGFSMGDALGRIPARLLHGPETDPATADAIRLAIMQGSRVNAEILHYTREGRAHWVSTDIEPIRDPAGRLANFVILESDITERKASEKMLQQAKEAAESASRAKSEFVANMSHEIRTPMNGVLGMTELLLDTDLNEGQRRYAKNIRNSADALLNIINDILDFSKIEAGKMELDPVDFDVRELTEEVAEMAAGRAHAKGIELLCRIDESVPAAVKGDAGRLRQVLTNLVGNAVKFTERGEVLVEVRAVCQDPVEELRFLEFSIVDTGIGISRDAVARLFTAFTQADSSTTRRFGGTGLGLAISRQLVRLMGGEIEIDSEPGRGSRFRFRVKVDAADASVSGWVARDDLRGLEVLIVEDNRTNSDILMHHVTTWGMAAHAVATAEQAVDVVAARGGRGFDLALIDWKLPGMSGIDLARALRASGDTEAMRLILLTSMTASNVAQIAREAGFAAHLCKPLRREELYRTVARTLGVAGAAPETAIAKSEIQGAGGQVLLVEDNQVNQDIGAAMLGALGMNVDIANNGIEALALAGRKEYDLVLMDCQMPEMDGFAATAEIRAREAASGTLRTPIVALTANAMQGDRERCLAAGMDDYLAKPFSKTQLAAVIARWAAPRGNAESTAVAAGDLPPAGATGTIAFADAADGVTVLDQAALANIRALERPGKPSLLERVIERYLTDAAKLYAQMRLASEAGDGAGLLRAAHTLKSASANVGAGGAAELCKALESGARSGETAFAVALLDRLEPELDRVGSALRQELPVAA